MLPLTKKFTESLSGFMQVRTTLKKVEENPRDHRVTPLKQNRMSVIFEPFLLDCLFLNAGHPVRCCCCLLLFVGCCCCLLLAGCCRRRHCCCCCCCHCCCCRRCNCCCCRRRNCCRRCHLALFGSARRAHLQKTQPLPPTLQRWPPPPLSMSSAFDDTWLQSNAGWALSTEP